MASPPMRATKLSGPHFSCASRYSLSLSNCCAILGLAIEGKETVEEQKTTTAFLPVGESEVEILEPTAADSAVARFIEARGEGVQHIALRVENVADALKELKEKGERSI